MTAPRKPAKSRTHYGACAVKCSGGNACVCDSRQHFWHTCSDVSCVCHAQVLREPLVMRRVPFAAPAGYRALDLLALVRRIGGKRVKPGVGRAPYAPRDGKKRG